MEQVKRQKYSDKYEHEAVDLILSHGYGVAEAARNLGINAGMLGRWKTSRCACEAEKEVLHHDRQQS